MISFRRFLWLASAALLALCLTALPALAAEGAEPDPADTTTGLIFRWLNFLIVFGGIAYFVSKSGGFFRSNAKEIAANIVQATAAKEEATRELQRAESKVQHLDQDVRGIARASAPRLGRGIGTPACLGRGGNRKDQSGGARRIGRLRARRAAAIARHRGIPRGGKRRRAGRRPHEPGNARQDFPDISCRSRKEQELKALAERYASALVDVALENKQADLVKQELSAFTALVGSSPELHAFLANPSIARASKHAAIEQIVARMGASRTLRNYLFVIVDQRRAGMLLEIEQAFSRLLDARQGITQAAVTFGDGADLPGTRRAGRGAGEIDRGKSPGAVQDRCSLDRRRRGADRLDHL